MREIKLTRGKVTIVDDEDFEFLNKWKWNAQPDKDNFYAVRTENIDKKRVQIRMHRLILNLKNSSIQVDHKDRNGLNNQKNNIRIATVKENSYNKKSHKNSTSKYKGVNWYPRNKKWGVKIRKNGIQKFLGLYKDEIEAAKIYDKAAKEYFGEFANLNFKS